MYYFVNDYSDICQIELLDRLKEKANEFNPGYGFDKYTERAKETIKKILDDEDIDIYFLTGGTIVNIIGSTQGLRGQDSIISAKTGHINTHEAGSIEATGTKIETIETEDGKLTVELLTSYIKTFDNEFSTVPKVVYVSNSTELGTIYTKKELKDIHDFCKENSLYLYIDGARLSQALASSYSDIEYSDLTDLADIFSIGGTKNGLPFGEVLVVKNDDLKKNMINLIKQKGALLAKGFILGLLFDEAFSSSIYFDNANHAFKMAKEVNDGLEEIGVPLAYEFNSNQIFILLNEEDTKKLGKDIKFEIHGKKDNFNIIRLVCTYRTNKDDVNALLNRLGEIWQMK